MKLTALLHKDMELKTCRALLPHLVHRNKAKFTYTAAMFILFFLFTFCCRSTYSTKEQSSRRI